MLSEYSFHDICVTWLSNYLLHSTLIILILASLVRIFRTYLVTMRGLIWRTALVGGALTATFQTLVPAIHYGPQISLPAFLDSQPVEIGFTDRRDDSRFYRWQSTSTTIANSGPHLGSSQQFEGGLPIEQGDSSQSIRNIDRLVLPILLGILALAAVTTAFRISCDWIRLRRVELHAVPIRSGQWRQLVETLGPKIGLRRVIQLFRSSKLQCPLAAGCFRYRILLPDRIAKDLNQRQAGALVAHELAHLSKRDPFWSLISEIICGLLFFQPLNFWVRRQLRMATEFDADRTAAELLNDPVGVARTLVNLSEWMTQSTTKGQLVSPVLSVGMAGNRSLLRERVESLLDQRLQTRGISPRLRRFSIAGTVSVVILMAVASPRTVSGLTMDVSSSNAQVSGPNPTEIAPPSESATLEFAVSDAHEHKPGTESETLTNPIAVPKELHNFCGQLIGRLVSKDIEAGRFVVTVDHVSRVWRNNKADNPKSAVGKTFVVDSVFGKWLDVLLILRAGDTLEFEARHLTGDSLSFLGENLRKTAPVDLANFPQPPEGFRGFHGMIVGKVLKKNDSLGDMIIHVTRIPEVANDNAASIPTASVGKPIMIAGIYGEMLKPFQKIKVGDTVRAQINHRSPQSDHFSLDNTLETISPNQQAQQTTDKILLPEGMHGFRGILVGQLLNKDVEKGTLLFQAERAKRVWKQNRAQNLQSAKGRAIAVRGISGEFLDVLLLLNRGDRFEVEAFHNGGNHLDFVGEWLKKIAPEDSSIAEP